jgi:hypothetical protein
MKKSRVIKSHQAEFPVPLELVKGEQIEGEIKKTEWEGWVWCHSSAGIKGWVPIDYLQAIPEKEGWFLVLQNYNARELTAQKGEILEVSEEEAGEWVWTTSKSGQSGWIPLENIEKL